MIVTVTPNPAVDLSGVVQGLIPNEKNYVSEERRDPGGNGINSARILTRLKARCLALGFAGGPTGDELIGLLKKEKVPHRLTRIQANTRTNVTVSNLATHQQTRLTFPGPQVSRRELSQLLSQIEKLKAPGLLILSGSLPEGCPPDFHLRLARIAARRGLGLVIDVPARVLKPVTQDSKIRAVLMKPNQTELEEWSGRKFATDAEIAEAARELARHSALVCVSLADRGAILATRKTAWFCPAPKIEAKGTVGAGDSMVGGMCAQLDRHRLTSPEAIDSLLASQPQEGEIPAALAEVLRWGLASGAATAEVSGTALAQPKEIQRLVRITRLEETIRRC